MEKLPEISNFSQVGTSGNVLYHIYKLHQIGGKQITEYDIKATQNGLDITERLDLLIEHKFITKNERGIYSIEKKGIEYIKTYYC